MKRRAFLGLAAIVVAQPALAQARRPKVLYFALFPISDPPSRERQAFLDGLRERGYVPGRNVEIVYRSAEGAEDFLDDVAQDVVAQKPDVIVVIGALPLAAVRKATTTIPIVMAVGDPAISGVSSLSHPEGNVTGVSFLSTELAAKRVQLIHDFLPGAKRVGVLWDKRSAHARAESGLTVDAVKRLGLTVAPYPLGSDAELRAAMTQMQAGRPDALYVALEGIIVNNNRTAIAQFGVQNRIPIVSGYGFLTEAGGFMSYSPDIPRLFRRSAYYVERILKGAKPRELPVEQAETVELIVNMKTARALGIPVPHALLVRADRVIE